MQLGVSRQAHVAAMFCIRRQGRRGEEDTTTAVEAATTTPVVSDDDDGCSVELLRTGLTGAVSESGPEKIPSGVGKEQGSSPCLVLTLLDHRLLFACE